MPVGQLGSLNFANLVTCGHSLIKKSPVKVEGNLMFSQRNNPYCDLLQISMANLRRKIIFSNFYGEFL